MSFGREIRRRRKAAGMTLEKLAERARLTANYIGQIEADQRDPSLSVILAVAKALRATPGDLLGGVAGLGVVGTEAGRLVEALSEDAQVALLAFLRTLPRRRR